MDGGNERVAEPVSNESLRTREVQGCPELEAMVSGLVGRYFIDSVQEALKRAMLQEALRRTRANYARTADLLGVKRQAVQQMVTRMGLKAWAESIRSRRIELGSTPAFP